MICPKCGAMVQDQASFCPACGACVGGAAPAFPVDGAPGAPVGSDAPIAPGASVDPVVPGVPVDPAAPGAFVSPGVPVGSDAPVAPGVSVAPAAQANYYPPQYAAASPRMVYPMTDTDRTLRLIAFVLCLVSTVIAGFAIFPLAWMIPMTVISWGIYKGTKRNTVAFGVCMLLFCSIVSGILLLCSRKDA